MVTSEYEHSHRGDADLEDVDESDDDDDNDLDCDAVNDDDDMFGRSHFGFESNKPSEYDAVRSHFGFAMSLLRRDDLRDVRHDPRYVRLLTAYLLRRCHPAWRI